MPNEQHLNKIVLVVDTDDKLHRDLSRSMRTELPNVGLLFETTTLFALMDSAVVSFGAIVLGMNADARAEDVAANCDLLGKRFPETGLILLSASDGSTPTVGNWIVIPDRDVTRLLGAIKRVLETS
jgi:hypothetical protein